MSQSKNQNIFCLLTRSPDIVWLDFLDLFYGCYRVFVVIDSQEDYSYLKSKYTEITFVQISSKECRKAGYSNSDYMFKKIVATDMAFYYFNRIETSYNHIWFCEDDVFFKDEDVLLGIDNKFPNADLITNNIHINRDGKNDGWRHWHSVGKTLNVPWARCLVCLMRASRGLMVKVDDFVVKNKKLIYKEILFHTLALHNEMEIQLPKEMSKIRWPKEWTYSLIKEVGDKQYAYHPVKYIATHIKARMQI